jgi:hypothetical protein
MDMNESDQALGHDAVVLAVNWNGPQADAIADAVAHARAERLRILLLIVTPRVTSFGFAGSVGGLVPPDISEETTAEIRRTSLEAIPRDIPVTVLVASCRHHRALRHQRTIALRTLA